MNRLPAEKNRRVLVIDDNHAIHDDFRKILCPATATARALDATETALFGGAKHTVEQTQFEVDSAYQGREGVLLAAKAIEAGRPYAMAFVDVRMPPGWDGVETTQRIWAVDPDIQIVICTAYSDYSWSEMFEKLGQRDGLLILKKPFDSVEAFQIAHALTEKWRLHRQSRQKMEELESRVVERTRELQQTNDSLQREVGERERAEAFLNSVIENIPIAVFIKEAKELRFVRWNQAGEKLTGIPNAEMIGKSDYDFFPSKDADLYVANDRAAFEKRGVLEIPEEVIQTRDHGARVTHVWKVPIFDAMGQPAFLLGISDDITERKRAEEALRESEDRYRLLVEESPDGIGIYLDGKLVFVNSTATRQLGAKTQAELLGRTNEQIIHPDDLSYSNDRVRRRLAGESGMYPAEVRYLRLDGTTIPVEVSAAPIIFNGKPAMQFIARDITERKKIEQFLRASQANLAAAQRIAHFGSWEMDLTNSNNDDANALRWSDEMFRIAGYEPGAVEVSNELFFRLVHPDDRALIRQAMATAISERGRYSIVHRLIRSDGAVRVLHEAGEILFDEPTGQPLKVVGTAHDITEQRKAEEALRESEERFSGAFEHAPIGMALVLPDGHWLQVNPVLCELVGYAEAELLPRTFQDITHPDDLAADLENVRRLIAGEIRSYEMEKRYVHQRGHFVTVLLSVSLVRDDQGQPRYFISHIQDITERKQAENALRESNEKFQQLADNLTDAFWVRSPDMREVHYISPAFERIWGRSVDCLYANPERWPDFILPEDRERVLGTFASFAGDSPRLDIEYRIVRPDGGVRWVHLRASQVRDAAGKLIRLTGIVSDITERKRVEMSVLAFSKLGQRLSSAASAREAFIIIKEVSQELFGWDAFRIRLYSAQTDSFYSGFTVDTVKGQPVAEEQNEPVKPGPLYRRVIAQGGELILRDPPPAFGPGMDPFGDVTRPSAALMFVAILSRGHVVGMLSIQSYTPYAYNQEDLKTLQTMADQCGGAIERIWADEALRKAETQLFQSQKLETVGKLAGGVAHEFNSILTAIIGQSELIQGELPPGHALAHNAAEISQAAERAATLTRQLLAYGRRTFLQPESLDLNQVIASMAATIRHLIGGAVEVRIVPAAGLLTVKADAGQIEQVIMNLVMNAADAMPHGGKLTLETANITFDPESVVAYPDLKPGDYVQLAITDTGAGMSEAVKARAFEPFFTTKDIGQGTGLGLSTCYGIIKQSGGHISVYSEPGRGTTFKIYLPQNAPQASQPLRRLDAIDMPRGTETVLLVEDDPALREMAAILLRRLGYTVYPAANGVEALSVQHERSTGHIDLLFTDVVMSHMSGTELADRVRALHPRTRILFTSAYTANASVHQGVFHPGVPLLQKPFTPSALAQKIREVLDQPRAPEPAPHPNPPRN